MFRPAYLSLPREDLHERARQAVATLADCRACPRDCRVNRLEDKYSACKTGRYAVVSSHFPHFGEEDCLRGWNGSGTIFFSHCNLRCIFCFHPDTLIPTDEGLRRIADIFERSDDERRDGRVRFINGDARVATREGTWAPVTKAFRHHFAGDLIRLKPYNCPPLLLTPNHEVFVVPKADLESMVKVPAGQLNGEHYLIVPKRTPAGKEIQLDLCELLSLDPQRFRKSAARRVPLGELDTLFAQTWTSYELAEVTGYHPAYVRKLRGEWRRGQLFPDDGWAENGIVKADGRIRFKTEGRPGIPARITLDEPLAWLFGIYCAEGHVTSQKNRPNSHRLYFSFGHHEVDMAHRVKHLLQGLFGVEAGLRWRRTTITVEVGKASLGLLFAKLCGKGSHEKQVPFFLNQATSDVVEAFLQGIAAGDGYDSRTHLVINTVSEKLAMGLFEIGVLLGMLPSYHKWHPAPTKVIEGRIVNQSPLHYVKFPKINPKTGKRHSRRIETDDYFLVPIHKMERVPYEGPVFNIEVDDPDHSYLAPYVAVGNCQNYDISQAIKPGKEDAPKGSPPEAIAGMMLELQEIGCHNVNFVTPEHVVPQVLEAVAVAVEYGLKVPIIYNTSAYDSMESLAFMDGIVDVYMPDFKYWSAEASRTYMKAENYPEAAKAAIKEMHRQVGDLIFDADGLAQRGLLIRHLVMPGNLDETHAILEWIATELGPNTYVNLMDQYYPAGKVSAVKYPEINRRLDPEEFREAQHLAREVGLHRLDARQPHPRLLRRSWTRF